MAALDLVGGDDLTARTAASLLGAEVALSIKKAGVWWFSSRARPQGNEIALRAVIAPDLL